MDGAFIGSIAISIDKAYTAVAFETQTKDLVSETQPNQSLFGLHTTNDGRVVIFPGGIPLVRERQVRGAIGVSTGTVGAGPGGRRGRRRGVLGVAGSSASRRSAR